MIPARSILAPVDFSEASRAALTCAARLAKRWRAELHVLHVLDPLLSGAAATRGIDLAGESREALTDFMRSSAPAGEWAPLHHVVTGRAIDTICHTAKEHGADLIVLGVHGLSGIARAVMGSTTGGVIRATGVSVLAVPGQWTPPQAEGPGPSGWGPIIAGVEDPQHLGAVARAADELALSLDASLQIAHVVPDLPVLARWRAHADAALAARVEQARRDLAASLRALRPTSPADMHVGSGHVAETLTAMLGEHRAAHPMLVLGRAHGTGGHAPGAVASRVIAQSEAPVFVYLPER